MRKFSGVLLLFILICSQLTAQSKQLSLNDFLSTELLEPKEFMVYVP